MPLTDEQRSMLQLLLGGQSYDDIASLLGASRDEVRSRARDALREMGGADPDAQVALSDFLLGQADPIGRADAVRHLQNDAEANALARNLLPQLRLLAPQAELPEVPAARAGRRAPTPAPPAVPTPPSGPPGAPSVPAPPPTPGPARQSLRSRIVGAFSGLSADRRRSQLLIGLGALAFLIVAGVLLVIAGGDDDSGSSATEETASVPTDANLTVVQLSPLSGDSQASGQAVFAQTGDQPLLQINLSGLSQIPDSQIYIVWLYNSDRFAFPLARDEVGEDGNLTGAAPIPQELVPLLPQFGCVDVSLASKRQTQQALQQAAEGQALPQHSGETVLRGQVPANPGEQAPTGADSQCEGAPPAQGAGGAGGVGGAEGGGAEGSGQ